MKNYLNEENKTSKIHSSHNYKEVNSFQLYNLISAPIFVINKTGEFLYFNDNAESEFPYFFNTIHQSLLIFNHPFFKVSEVRQLLNNLLINNEPFITEASYVNTELSQSNKFRCIGKPINPSENYIIQLYKLSTSENLQGDVTHSLEISKFFFNHAPLGIFYFNIEGKILEINKNFAEIIGTSREDLLGFNVFKQLKDTELKILLQKIIKTGITEYVEKDYISTLANKKSSLRGIFSPVKQGDGTIIGGIGLVEDLSPVKKAIYEAYLLKSSQQSFLDGLPFMAWIKDVDGRFVAANNLFCQQLKSSIKDIIGKKDSKIIHNPIIASKYEKEDNEVLTNGIPKHFEDYLIDDNETEHWFESYKIPLFDTNKNIIGLAGYSIEISDRKQNEQFINSVINSLPNPVLVKNEKFKWIYVNNAFCKYFNVSLSEYIGKTNEELFPEDKVNLLRESESEIFKQGKILEYEDTYITKEGVLLEFIVRKSVLNNQNGEKMLIGVITDITERKKNIQALEQSELRLRNITDSIPGKVFQMELFPNSYPKFHFISKGSYDLYELTPETIIQNPESITKMIYREDLPGVIKNLAHVLKSKKIWEYEYRILTPSKKTKWIRVFAVPFKNKEGATIWTGVSIDITEKKQFEQELSKRTELLEIATKELNNLLTDNDFENAISAFLTKLGKKLATDRAYIFRNNHSTNFKTTSLMYEWASKPQYKQYGNPELFNIPFSENQYNWYYNQLSDGKPIKGNIKDFPEYKQVNPIKQNIVSSILLPIINKTGFWGFIGFDCTNTRHFTKAETYVLQAIATSLGAFFDRKEYEEKLSTAKIKAEESEKLKTNFLSNMSHELRTPLNGILGFANILKNELKSPEHIDIIDTIEFSGNRLLETMNLILDLSTLESNQLIIKCKPLSITQLIQDITPFYISRAYLKGISFQTEIQQHYYLLSDEKILRTVLKKLLDNALKYTKKGFIKVEATHEESDVSNTLLIRVSDSGIGIPETFHATIFEPFRQASEGYTREYEGSGLGLSLAKKYINLLKGDIILESTPGKGSAFTIKIPEVKLTDQPTITSIKDNDNQNDSIFKYNILVVEDDYTNRKYLEIILKNRYNVFIADNGPLALQLAEKNKFDIILMDINLGREMNGIEATELIRNMDAYKDTPIAAVTANAMAGQKEAFLKSGFTHYISKPFKKDELLNLVKTMISSK